MVWTFCRVLLVALLHVSAFQAQFSARDGESRRWLSLQERLSLHQSGQGFSQAAVPVSTTSAPLSSVVTTTVTTSTASTTNEKTSGRRQGLASLLTQRQSRILPSKSTRTRQQNPEVVAGTESPIETNRQTSSVPPNVPYTSLPSSQTDKNTDNGSGRSADLASLIERLRARVNAKTSNSPAIRGAKAINVYPPVVGNQRRLTPKIPDESISEEVRTVAYWTDVTTEDPFSELNDDKQTTLYSLASVQNKNRESNRYAVRTRQTQPPIDRFKTVNLEKVTNFGDFTPFPSSTESTDRLGQSELYQVATRKPEVTTKSADKNLGDIIAIKEIDVAAFLPAGYELNFDSTPATETVASFNLLDRETTTMQKTLEDKETTGDKSDLLSLLPTDYKIGSGVGDKSNFKIEEVDVSKFLPPGYQLNEDSQTTDSPELEVEKTSSLSPTDDKTKSSKTNDSKSVSFSEVDVASLLPTNYKSDSDSANVGKFLIQEVDVSSFLPPGYEREEDQSKGDNVAPIPSERIKNPKPSTDTSISKNVQKSDNNTTNESHSTSRTKLGVIFPGGKSNTPRSFLDFLGFDKKKVISTPLPPVIYNSTESLMDRIKNRPKFTGWPTEPTQPTVSTTVSLLKSSANTPSTGDSTSSTTTTTTTTTTTRVPTTPGYCGSRCKMAATVRIVEGVKWRPELAVRGTRDWMQTASLVQLELMEAFRASPLGVWVDKVNIDAFSKGSVMVDYYVYFNDKLQNLNTRDAKILFEEGLLEDLVSGGEKRSSASSSIAGASSEDRNGGPSQRRPMLQMGAFLIDPDYNDFVVFRDPPVAEQATNNYLIPEWLIAVIAIGLTALLFMLVFGCVLMWNRRQRRKSPARASLPLTADVLNELDRKQTKSAPTTAKYGDYDVYDPDDAWDNDKVARAKRMRSPIKKQNNVVKNYNIYDSWRSDFSAVPSSGAWSRKMVQNTFDKSGGDF